MKALRWMLALGVLSGALGMRAAEPAPQPAVAGQVGVYDSRAVAYAHFWSAPTQAWLKAQTAAAGQAKAAGDNATYERISRELRAHQERMHLEVFGTAPAREAMTSLSARLPVLQAELGVSLLLSKWDRAVEGVPPARRVDATDALVREFSLPAEKLRMIEQIKAAKPISSARGKLLNLTGGW